MPMRILNLDNQWDLTRVMREIRVDPYGVGIMLPKAISYLIRINRLSCIEANILKQEMLSLGADAAVSRDTLTGKNKKTDCLLMGNCSQYSRLAEKLNKQPFGLSRLAGQLNSCIANYRQDNFIVDLGRFRLTVKPGHTGIMGIVNITPDSFSGDGLLKNNKSRFKSQEYILDYVEKMVSDGADIIDVGAESTRPKATPVTVKEELSRVIPVIRMLAKKINKPISVDTYKPQVAKAALDSGAVLVNDTTGLKDPRMIKVISRAKGAVVIMHSKGTPLTMQRNPRYESLFDEIIGYLDNAASRALGGGISKNSIIIDPGIGFGKTVGHNFEIIRNLREFKIIGYPLLVGTSRKSFIGKMLNALPRERLIGTISSCVLALNNGANFLRVHDVKQVKDAVRITDAVNNSGRVN